MELKKEINKPRYVVVKLKVSSTVKAFDCGDADLNEFILRESPLYQKEKLAVTYVMKEATDIDNEHIVAFFSLANDRISISDFDSKTKYNRFSRKFNNRKRLKSYPAVKVVRLGVNQPEKGNGLGGALLDFIKNFYTIDNKAGCRFITVDAYAAAVPFYINNGFMPLNDEDINDPTRLLYFDLNELNDD